MSFTKYLLPEGYDIYQFEDSSEQKSNNVIRIVTYLVNIEKFQNVRNRLFERGGHFSSILITEEAAAITALVKNDILHNITNNTELNRHNKALTKETGIRKVIKYVIRHGLQQIEHSIEQEKTQTNREHRRDNLQSSEE